MGHVIRYFDKVSESYIGEEKLPYISLEVLQDIFGVPSENPMYDSFPIGEKQAAFLKKYMRVEVEMSKYDYFLEFDS